MKTARQTRIRRANQTLDADGVNGMAEKIIRTFKYRIYPSKAQTTRLNDTLALCCELYNAALQERRDAWTLERKSVGYFEQSAQLPEIKIERPELNDISSQVLQDTLRRVNKTFQRFFRHYKEGRRPGFPRFKWRHRYRSLTYPQYPEHGFSLRGLKLRLSKIGDVKMRLHRPIEGKIKRVTITRTATNKWYAAFSTENAAPSLFTTSPGVGIDVGLTHFATLSTGEQVPNPRFFREEQSALAKAQRNGKRKATRRIHERIKFRRHNFAHQLSRYLVDRFGFIVFEDLNIGGMVKNHHLAKSIADAAWSQLFQYTSYKAENAGGLVKQIDPRNTSRLTACCGELVEMTLSDRVIHCPKCHSTTDRDFNASLNILSRGLAALAAA